MNKPNKSRLLFRFVAKEKIEGGPSEDIKKFAKKSLTKPKYHPQQNFGQERDSNPRPPAWQTSKNPT